MDRRTFLQTLSTSLLAGSVTGLPVQAAGESWKAEFHRALRQKPWLLGFQSSTRVSHKAQPLQIEGTLPKGLRGTFYRNGAARHEIGDMRYHHWFDGDGMVHAYRFDENGVTHLSRFVDTAKSLKESAAGHPIYPGFGTLLPNMEGASKPDDLNTANINIIRHNGELLALWEGGSAHRLDPETLETLGLKTWSKPTAGAPFGAHPRTDADGTMWNIGYAPTAGALILYRISPNGKVVDTGVLPMASVPMVHDFMITQKHLVLFLSPYAFHKDREGAFIEHFKWQPDQGARVLIIEKDDLSAIREVEAPPVWIFHFANAHQEASGQIRFSAPVYDGPEIMTDTFREVMRGRDVDSKASQFMSMTLNPESGVFQSSVIEGLDRAEFPRIAPDLQGQRHRYTYAMQASDRGPTQAFDHVVRIDHDAQTTQRYRFADHELAEEHIFVPDTSNDAEGSGWLLGTSLDIERKVTVLNIFHADAVQDGPIARASLDHAVPLGLHGNFYA